MRMQTVGCRKPHANVSPAESKEAARALCLGMLLSAV